ncbi:MAG: family 43 glycosylhydrolase [Kiritimatiellae bacterium]|nr:family 43 glycosylhydrolase [Kiritimatiellia bacterium]
MQFRISAVLLFAALPAVAQGGVAFTNPVWRADAPDPTCWRADDGYYLTSTARALLKSTDLVHWQKVRDDFLAPGERARIKRDWRGIWAPDVARIGNAWNLYVSYWNGAENTAIAVYTCDRPEGPFTNGVIVTDGRVTGIRDTIDPDAVVDPETGKTWLFFGSVGKVHRVELTADGRALAPGAAYVHVAGLNDRDPKSRPHRRHVFEGTYLYHRGDWWYLFASSGEYNHGTYAVVVGRARHLTDDFTDRAGRLMKEGFAETILRSRRGDRFYGPGHNGEIFTAPSGRTYMIYHCHDRAATPYQPHGYNPRPLFLQEVLWDADGWPYFETGRPVASGEFR